MDKIKCFFGYHLWSWKLRQGESLALDGIPYHATCKHCGKPYNKYYIPPNQ